ncbi:MAG TPA: hypothetical protein VF092_07805 [Longimicrobium sp.]
MFDLKIYFTGVMLFVAEDDEMHILMPQTEESIPAPVVKADGGGHAGHGNGGDGHPVEPHVARITFDTAHTREGAQQEDGAIGHVSMRKTRLNIPALGDAYVRGIPPEVARVPRPVRRTVVEGKENNVLVGRVHVARGKATAVARGLCWKVNEKNQRMTNQIEWTIGEIDAKSLQLEMLSLDGFGKAGSGVPTLFPIGGVIELFIWHAPPFEIPPGAIAPEKPQPGDRNHHFSHLDVLLEPAEAGKEQAIPMPVLIGDDCPATPSGSGDGSPETPEIDRGRDPDRGGLTLTCTPGT